MRTLIISFALLLNSAVVQAAVAAQDFQVIAYHDVRDNVREKIDADQYAISTRHLIDHFTWLRTNGFTPISVSDLLAAREGSRPLPEKAVLLTFDDGFRSVFTHVYPLLRLFNYPAVVSIVTGWVNGDAPPPSGDPTTENHPFLTWDEIREMHESGLVEIGSHTHDLHHGSQANPQGNEQPSTKARRFVNGQYETETEHYERVRGDLQRSVALIAENIGVTPRVMTWPYGAYSKPLVDVASELGMPITLTLDSHPNHVTDLKTISRHLVLANPEVDALGYDLLHADKPPAVRAAQVDLDYVYDADPIQQEANLGHLLDRIKALQISHVFLQAFADPDADGGAQALYFPNRHLPVRGDLFNRVAWQLRSRADVSVYAWLPILSFQSESIDPGLRVQQNIKGALSLDENAEPRLSPFAPEARQIIQEIYEDLAVNTPVAGILFHDDGRLNEFEDASTYAMEAYRGEFGDQFSIEDTFADPDLQRRWAQFKAQAIVDLTNNLMAAVRQYQPTAKSARNAFSGTLLDPAGEIYLSQNFELLLNSYDHVALMAMPYFENAANPQTYFEALIEKVGILDKGYKKTIFELQTVDWRTNTPIPVSELRATMRWLQANGVRHLAYYPDDFIKGTPELRGLRQGLSLAQYPIEVPR